MRLVITPPTNPSECETPEVPCGTPSLQVEYSSPVGHASLDPTAHSPRSWTTIDPQPDRLLPGLRIAIAWVPVLPDWPVKNERTNWRFDGLAPLAALVLRVVAASLGNDNDVMFVIAAIFDHVIDQLAVVVECVGEMLIPHAQQRVREANAESPQPQNRDLLLHHVTP